MQLHAVHNLISRDSRVLVFLRHRNVKAAYQTLMLLAVAVAGTAITDLPIFN